MNIKRIFGSILTLLGSAVLIYGAFTFVSSRQDITDVRSLVIYAALGLIFFIAGIGLVRATKDAS